MEEVQSFFELREEGLNLKMKKVRLLENPD